jgi:hypothetical protein
MAITSTALDTTASPIYTSTGNSAVTVLYLCNRSGTATTFSLYIVPEGGSAEPNNIAYSNQTIASGDTYIIDTEKVLLSDGDSLQASANTADSIVATTSYVGI